MKNKLFFKHILLLIATTTLVPLLSVLIRNRYSEYTFTKRHSVKGLIQARQQAAGPIQATHSLKVTVLNIPSHQNSIHALPPEYFPASRVRC